jgi:hypothetical protein
MRRLYHHHYLIQDQCHLGWPIGLWHTEAEYAEYLADPVTITLYGDPARRHGIWIPGLNMKLEEKARIDKSDISELGIDHGAYIDLVKTFDRTNNEIHVGDDLFVAVTNEVRRAQVTKIAARPVYVSSIGYARKLTVIDDEGKTLTINNSRSTVKV